MYMSKINPKDVANSTHLSKSKKEQLLACQTDSWKGFLCPSCLYPVFIRLSKNGRRKIDDQLRKFDKKKSFSIKPIKLFGRYDASRTVLCSETSSNSRKTKRSLYRDNASVEICKYHTLSQMS